MFILAAASDANAAQTLAALSAFIGFFAITALVFTALFVWMFWRIFVKAGFNGALSLLCLIPPGQLICVAILAFSTWPNERPGVPVVTGTIPTSL